MAVPTYTIKIKAGVGLMDRIRDVSRYLDVTPGQFVEHAIESELRRQEVHQIKEDIALEELRKNVLDAGQAMEVLVGLDDGEVDHCQLCLKALPALEHYEGPHLCKECLGLAQGAQLEKLERRKH